MSKAHAAAEFANARRLSEYTMKEMADELRTPQRTLRREVLAAVDEQAREVAVTAMRIATAAIHDGRRAVTVPIEGVLGAGKDAKPTRLFRGTREHLVVGGADPEIGWAIEHVDANRRTTAVVPARTPAVDAFAAKGGRVVEGSLANLPAGSQFDVVREELHVPSGLPPADTFVIQRLERLRPAGRWCAFTESKDLAEALAKVAPRSDARIWVTEYTTFKGATPTRRYAVVIAKPRPTKMTRLDRMLAAGLTAAQTTEYLALLNDPANAARLRRKLEHVWHRGIVVDGEIAAGLLGNLTGNIAEIFADSYKQTALDARRAVASDAQLYTGVRIIRAATGQSKEFTDDIIAAERGGHLQVFDVFEIKAGAKGGQDATTQIFEWIEGELTDGDRIVAGGREYVYRPGSADENQVVGLARAKRHIVAAKGAENTGRRSASQVAAATVRVALDHDLTAAQIQYLARLIAEGLPPAP